MKKIKHELKSWDEGRAFMNRMAEELGVKVKENDANLSLKSGRMSISCHMDAREFAFIIVKLTNEALKSQIMEILNEFESN